MRIKKMRFQKYLDTCGRGLIDTLKLRVYSFDTIDIFTIHLWCYKKLKD